MTELINKTELINYTVFDTLYNLNIFLIHCKIFISFLLGVVVGPSSRPGGHLNTFYILNGLLLGENGTVVCLRQFGISMLSI